MRLDFAKRDRSSSIIGLPLIGRMTLFGKRVEPIRAWTTAIVFIGWLSKACAI